MRYFILFLLLAAGLSAQVINKTDSNTIRREDTLVVDNGRKDSLKIFKPTIQDYTFKTQFGQPQVFDTTFTVHKSYALTQYNNRDNFGKVQFANIGAGFQDLIFRVVPEQSLSVLPANKSHFIIRPEDVKYYDVKTPTTSFIYHSAMRQGAALQSTYTQNFGKNLNIAAEYMGLRSKGFYDNSLSANNHTLFSAHYLSPNRKYEAYAHYLHQNVNNQENGGIEDLALFTGGDSRFNDRENLTVNLNSSDSRFWYRRYYFSHSFRPFASEKFPFKIRHTIFHQGNKYYFNLAAADAAAFEAVLPDVGLSSKKISKNLSNTLSVIFDNERFRLDAGLRHQYITAGYRNVFITTYPDVLKHEQRLGLVGHLGINLWEKFDLNTDLEYSTGKLLGNYLRSANKVKFEPVKGYFVDADVNFQSAAPGIHWMMNASAILPANFDVEDFKNQTILEVGGTVGLKWFDARLLAKYLRIDNYAYFDSSMQPRQADTGLNISQLGGEATFNLGRFHLNTRGIFQSNLNNAELYPMPKIIARGNLYWQGWAFKKAAEIMVGVKAYYFSKFNSRAFSPVLNEFILPGSDAYAIGGQPIGDVYLNLRIKTMQFYIEGQHFNTTFSRNRSYTAPYYPIYDFRLNIGIVWQLFH